jgi:hypothetical protein
MNVHADLQLQIVNQRMAEDHRHAAMARSVGQRRTTRNRSIRRVIGSSVIRIGEWLAADGELRPAGSR